MSIQFKRNDIVADAEGALYRVSSQTADLVWACPVGACFKGAKPLKAVTLYRADAGIKEQYPREDREALP